MNWTPTIGALALYRGRLLYVLALSDCGRYARVGPSRRSEGELVFAAQLREPPTAKENDARDPSPYPL